MSEWDVEVGEAVLEEPGAPVITVGDAVLESPVKDPTPRPTPTTRVPYIGLAFFALAGFAIFSFNQRDK